MKRSRETGFYELLPGNSVKLKISLKHRGARLLNHLHGKTFFVADLKIESWVCENLSEYIQKFLVAHKLSDMVFEFKLHLPKSEIVKLLNSSGCYRHLGRQTLGEIFLGGSFMIFALSVTLKEVSEYQRNNVFLYFFGSL